MAPSGKEMEKVSGETRKKVDEDWKRSAKAPAGRSVDAARSSSEGAGLENGPGSSERLGDAGGPIDLSALISSLGVQTLVHLGQVPDQVTGKKDCDMGRAKQTIELIEILHEKTRGNLTEEESKLIEDTLYGLHMSYVAVSGEQGASSQPDGR